MKVNLEALIADNGMMQCAWQFCTAQFDQPNLLYIHLCEAHVGRKSLNNLQLTCAWRGCGTTCIKRDHMTSHVKVHTAMKPHECPGCEKAFKRRPDLKKHMRIHDQPRQQPSSATSATFSLHQNHILSSGESSVYPPGELPMLDDVADYSPTVAAHMEEYSPAMVGTSLSHHVAAAQNPLRSPTEYSSGSNGSNHTESKDRFNPDGPRSFPQDSLNYIPADSLFNSAAPFSRSYPSNTASSSQYPYHSLQPQLSPDPLLPSNSVQKSHPSIAMPSMPPRKFSMFEIQPDKALQPQRKYSTNDLERLDTSANSSYMLKRHGGINSVMPRPNYPLSPSTPYCSDPTGLPIGYPSSSQLSPTDQSIFITQADGQQKRLHDSAEQEFIRSSMIKRRKSTDNTYTSIHNTKSNSQHDWHSQDFTGSGLSSSSWAQRPSLARNSSSRQYSMDGVSPTLFEETPANLKGFPSDALTAAYDCHTLVQMPMPDPFEIQRRSICSESSLENFSHTPSVTSEDWNNNARISAVSHNVHSLDTMLNGTLVQSDSNYELSTYTFPPGNDDFNATASDYGNLSISGPKKPVNVDSIYHSNFYTPAQATLTPPAMGQNFYSGCDQSISANQIAPPSSTTLSSIEFASSNLHGDQFHIFETPRNPSFDRNRLRGLSVSQLNATGYDNTERRLSQPVNIKNKTSPLVYQ